MTPKQLRALTGGALKVLLVMMLRATKRRVYTRPVVETAREAGLTERAVYMALAQLEEEDLIYQVPAGWRIHAHVGKHETWFSEENVK